MKRILFLFLVLIICNSLFAQNLTGQKALIQVAKNYFRSNPFDREFSKFSDHLLNDPTIKNKTFFKRSDTSFFYMSGDYASHNPFFFLPIRTKVVLAESEFIINDSLFQKDTIITYQLAGYTTDGKEGEDEVKKEYEKFNRKYIRNFKETDFTEIKSGNVLTGEIRNYYTFLNAPATLSVAWQRMNSVKEHVFVVTFRFKVSGNMAVIPVYEKIQYPD